MRPTDQELGGGDGPHPGQCQQLGSDLGGQDGRSRVRGRLPGL
jgi:hypothetical protein